MLHAVMAARSRQARSDATRLLHSARDSAPSAAIADPASRSDEAYDRVRADIVNGVLRPNQRLVEVELAERLGVSRTPVRETLQRLLLDEVRAALEGYAAFLAAGRATPDELSTLDALYPSGDHAFALGPDAQVELNERFHDGVIAAAANPRLAQLSRASRQYYFNHRIARRYDAEETRRSIEGHRQILTALGRGDAPAAEAHAREHVAYALAIVLTKDT
jgi:DNA-binding GntR family transcriptional regulator